MLQQVKIKFDNLMPDIVMEIRQLLRKYNVEYINQNEVIIKNIDDKFLEHIQFIDLNLEEIK